MTTSFRKMRITDISPQRVKEIRHFRFVPVSPPDAALYQFIPGQFVQVRTGPEEVSYFAIASGPGEGEYFELLVKEGKGTSGVLFNLDVGAEVEMTDPMGRGFPIDQYQGHDLLLLGVGTGIAPLRSVIKSALSRRADFGSLTFVYGVLTPDHLCYGKDLDHWSHDGVKVHLVVTDAEGTDWQGRSGFVQDILKDLKPHAENTVVMLVGMKEMVEENTQLLLEMGFPQERILLNF